MTLRRALLAGAFTLAALLAAVAVLPFPAWAQDSAGGGSLSRNSGSTYTNPLTYLTPSGGDDTAQIAAAFNTQPLVAFLPGRTYKISTAGVIVWSPLQTLVEGNGAVFDLSAIPQPATVAAGDEVHFATALPVIASGTAVRQGDGSMTFAGGYAGYLITAPPYAQVSIAATSTGGASLEIDSYLSATPFHPQSAPGTNTNHSLGVLPGTFSYSYQNQTAYPKQYWLTVNSSGATGNLTALTYTTPSAWQPIVTAILVTTDNTPTPVPSATGGGFDRYYAHPFEDVTFRGAGAGGYPNNFTPGVGVFLFDGQDQLNQRNVISSRKNIVEDGFAIGDVFFNSSFANNCENCWFDYGGIAWVNAGGVNTGEIVNCSGCYFDINTAAIDNGGANIVHLIDTHLDYNNDTIVNNQGNIVVTAGWLETNGLATSGRGAVITGSFGNIVFEGTNVLFTNPTVSPGNPCPFNVSNGATLSFNNIPTVQNMIGYAGCFNLSTTGTIFINGKIVTAGIAGLASLIQGLNPWVDNPVRTPIVAGATQTIVMPNNGRATQPVTLTSSTTITMARPTGFPYTGELLKLDLILQNGTGGFTPSFSNAIVWAGGTAPTYGTAANGENDVTITWDGTTWRGSLGLN